MVGLHILAGPRAAVIGGTLLATNYWFVMWNRAALMESTMTAFLVAAWAAYAASERRPWLGVVAGVCASLAFFTKAAAAFFVAALVLDALASHLLSGSQRAARLTLLGVGAAFLVAGAAFVIPEWTEYYRYNWLTAVERKPSYALADLVQRASWLPVAQDLFSRMWLVTLGAALGLAGVAARWRTARPAERLLGLWVLIGLLELIVHDSGNARRYVMFIPALIALAAILVASDRAWLPGALARARSGARVVALPLVLLMGYLVFGSLIRPLFAADVEAGRFATTVRLAAAASGVFGAVLFWRWAAIVSWLAARRIGPALLAGLVVLSLGWNGLQYARWAAGRTDVNYRASVKVGELLEPGTLVHGKLSNGLALENRIRPIFIGHGFGNYEDRLRRDDVRYMLTYVLPTVGYESQDGSGLIQEILDRYPDARVVATFDVQETPEPDRAQLILKHGRGRS